MKIFIKYLNNKVLLNTKKYQSIKGIINDFLFVNSVKEDIENFYLDYNGNYLNLDYSLEKYEIKENYTLTLNSKLKGGIGFDTSFFSYFMKNKLKVIFMMIIALLPVFLLPLGFFPVLSSLIKVIIDKSLDTISKYLICDLGKITLVKRLRFIAVILKYIILILMVYVMITLPLIILCITLKGRSLKDDPKSMCKPINVGSIAGIILTSLYLIIYMSFRFGNYILNPIISFLKKYYITNMLLVPIFSGLLSLYNGFKYLPLNFIPFGIGTAISAYLKAIGMIPKGFETGVSAILDIGCKADFSKIKKGGVNLDLTKNKTFMKNFSKIIGKENINISDDALHDYEINLENDPYNKNEEELKINIDMVKKIRERTINPLCIPDETECCNPKFFINVGEILEMILNNTMSASLLKKFYVYPSFILFIQSLYEYGIDDIDSVQKFYSSNIEGKKGYLQQIMENNSNRLSKSLKILIKDYLNNDNSTLLGKIKNDLEETFKNNDNEKKFYFKKIDLSDDSDLKKFYLSKIIEINNSSNSNDISISEKTRNLIKKYIKGDDLEVLEKIKDELYKIYPVNSNSVNELREKITKLDKLMIAYAKNEHSTYIPGDSLFKMIMKNIYINAYCNIISTAKTSNDVVDAMGKMLEVSDTLKAGTVSGIFLSMYYFLTYIILIICAIFKVF
jgi:hypothetical protein